LVYDLIVIGGGPAGYLAAERAGHAGLNTLLIEKRFIGGVCLNEGCIPSKALLYSAKIFDYTKHGEKYGVIVENSHLNHETVVQRKNKVVKTLVTGVKGKLRANKVTVVEGFAEISGKNADGYQVRVDQTTFTGNRLLIATGSEPIMPEIPGLMESYQKGYVLTNREILDLTTLPASLVIVGGGVIGLEMASYFNSAGCKVTVIEMLDHIAGNTEREISAMLLNKYQKKGVEFKLNAKVTAIKQDQVVYELNGETAASVASVAVPADKVLISIGRRPVTSGIGLENIGVQLEKGRIITDNEGKTNIPEVYAAGDVNGLSMLAHTAYREAEVTVANMLGHKDLMRYGVIPAVIYTNPEVASVGETEASAVEKGIDYEIAKISMRYSGRFIAENEAEDGICKLLIAKKNQQLIGVHLIGNYASEIIYGAGLMLETGMPIRDLKKLVFPHPTVSEIIREALFEI
jgi:dihydrolipoamide dehydrogenase